MDIEAQRRADDDLAVAERAAAWIAALEQGGSQTHAAFAAWLKQSPRHVEEALFAAAVSEGLRNFDPARRIDVKALLAEHSRNVVPLMVAPPPPRAAETETRPGRWAAAIAAATLGASMLAWWHGYGPGSWNSYATEVGEQHSVELIDGSLVHLNTQSAIAVRFSSDAREIRLVKGEALFQVAHDETRPFRVQSRNATIQAVGTEFDVDTWSADTRVAVIEGRVRISTPNATAVFSSAGESASISQQGEISAQKNIDAGQAVAWMQRRLIFQADTLKHVAEQFNRYNRAPKIRIYDESVSRLRFSGTFDANDPRSLANLLDRDPELTVVKDADEWVITRR